MSKVKIAGLVGVVVLAALVGGFYGFTKLKGEKAFGASNVAVNSTFSTTTDSLLNRDSDVVGTHSGTSTVPATYYTINATNTYVSVVGRNVKQANYHIKIVAVTTTINNLNVTVQGSNDWLCETQAGNASSTTDVVQKNINWTDAMVYMANRVHPTSFVNASTSLVMNWVNATADSSQTLVLTNLDFHCLRLLVSASGTQPYIGLSTK